MTNKITVFAAWKTASERYVPAVREKLLGLAKAHLNKRVKKFIFKKGPAWVTNARENRAAESPFFQLYPYHGPLRKKSVSAHSVVDLELGIFFHRIPKCANSSIVASISQLREGRALSSSQEFKRDLRKSLMKPADLSLDAAQKVKSLRKFVFVRNPYNRVLSAYLSKVAVAWDTNEQIRIHVTSRSAKSPLPTFAEFCGFLNRGGLYRNHHWYPQTDYLAFQASEYDFFGRVETIDADFKRLAQMIAGKETSLEMLPEDPAHRTGSTEAMNRYYTPELYDLVYDIYKADFETFGYSRIRGSKFLHPRSI